MGRDLAQLGVSQVKTAAQVSLGDVFFLNTRPCVPAATPRRLFAHHSIPAWDVTRGPVLEYGSEIGSNKFLLTRPTILVSKLNPQIPRVSLVERIDETTPQCSSTEFISYCARDKDTNLRFYRWFFESVAFRRRMISTAKGSTNSQVRTNPSETLGWPCPQPPPFDQNRIAAILDTIDEAIRQTDAVIEKLKKIKQGFLHDLLTRGIGKDGKLRPTPEQAPHLYKDSPLGKIPKEWVAEQIRDICALCRGASPRPIDDPRYFANEGPLWVRIADVTSAYKYLKTSSERVSPLGASKSVRIGPGDLIMSICATIGRPIICSAEACIHDGFVWFKELDERLSVEFMFYFLLMNEEFIGRQKQMGTQGNLNTDIVKKTWVPVPPRHAEQQNIVNACVVADEAVDKESRYLTKLMNLKQGLIEDLFTGRVTATGLPKDIEKMLDEIAGGN